MEERVRFKACDIPNADEFTINILAAVAQKGAKDISESTKQGLAAKKARGFTLGKPENFTATSRAQGRAVVQRNAQEAVANKQARRLAELLRRDGLTLAAIAAELNAHGYRTRQGKSFHKTTVAVAELLLGLQTVVFKSEGQPERALLLVIYRHAHVWSCLPFSGSEFCNSHDGAAAVTTEHPVEQPSGDGCRRRGVCCIESLSTKLHQLE